jgi:2-dehydro-3-deoxy-D-arabinonate dehydratase
MRYYRIRDSRGDTHLTAETQPGTLSSLTSLNGDVTDFRDLLHVSDISGMSIDDIARNVLSSGDAETFDLGKLTESSRSATGAARIIAPLAPDEIWAGGIGNYAVPDEAVAGMPPITKTAYEADRPPVMYKGTASRLAGPFDAIGIRGDTEKTVAEGELVLILYKGKLVGYSTGNEVAGGLMGETLWWMVPSKVFKGCASLGPCIVTPETMPDPTGRDMELTIMRDGKQVGSSTNTTTFRRSPAQIVEWTQAHDAPPDLVIIYTGGCVAAGPLEAGDVVRISLDGIGYVENTVEVV